MSNLFFRNRQLLFLTLTLILVWGLSAFFTLPRLEDPEAPQLFSSFTTVFPGASAKRVETLVTNKIEEELSDVEEIKEISSISSPGVSVVTVKLQDKITDAQPIWVNIRSRIDDIAFDLPAAASATEFRSMADKTSALIVGLKWDFDADVNYTILRRLAEDLDQQLRRLPGTDSIELFGAPDEEIQVEVNQAKLAKLGISAQSLSQQIAASDAKISAGELRNNTTELLLELSSGFNTLERIRTIPIQVGSDGQGIQLGDIARVTKGVKTPISDLALVDGQAAIVLSVTVESDYRVDVWARQARQTLADFDATLSDGLGLSIVLDQSQYVQQRLNGVINSLFFSSILVLGISIILLGWRSAIIVGLALPLSVLMVFGGMKTLNIPLHQISVTGLIISLGLLIDNAIVVVDEVWVQLQHGSRPAEAVSQTVKYLLMPLLASTLTTVLVFLPIAMAPGPIGKFMGSIGSVVILALLSSFVLSLTLIAALAGLAYRWSPLTPALKGYMNHWWVHGYSSQWLSKEYQRSLNVSFRRPVIGIGLALILPILGFIQFASLPQQFFPPTNRDQAQIEVEQSSISGISLTREQALQIRDLIRQHPAVRDVHWFLGRTAPKFFYNIIGSRRNASDYAQGIIQLDSTKKLRQTLQTLQQKLDRAFPNSQILVKQLEQGPPFNAPIEIELYGPDVVQLRNVGNQLRLILSQLDNVTHTQATLTELTPKLSLEIDETAARRMGLDNREIATQLNTLLDGTLGGSLLEDTEDIPVRVRLADHDRGNLTNIASLDLVGKYGNVIPLSAVATIKLQPENSTIVKQDGQLINVVQGFLTVGTLPSKTLAQVQKALKNDDFQLPPGYRLEYGGEIGARSRAMGDLLSTVGILSILMAATLVLSFNSFALAGLLAIVAVAAVGLAMIALWLFNSVFGFTAVLGTLSLVGIAVNDSIVVLAALRAHPHARQGDVDATQQVVVQSTRHVVATTITTVVGFVPLMLDPTGFWPPLAISIAGGLGGATLLALYFIPSAHLLLYRPRSAQVCPCHQNTLTSSKVLQPSEAYPQPNGEELSS